MDIHDIAYVPTTGVRRVHEAPLVVATDASLDGYGASSTIRTNSRSRSCAGRRRAGGRSTPIPAIRAG